MSSEKFELAQDELDTLFEELEKELRQLRETPPGEAKKRSQQICLKSIEEGTKHLEEMDGEARRAPLHYRAEMLSSVRSMRNRLATLQTAYHKAARWENREGKARDGGAGSSSGDQAYRERVMAGTRVLERTGESIQRSQRVALETEEVGDAIIGDLGTQRESLERTRSRLVDTDIELGRSRRILRKMYLNVISNRLILITVIVLEIGILIGLVYWKFFSK